MEVKHVNATLDLEYTSTETTYEGPEATVPAILGIPDESGIFEIPPVLDTGADAICNSLGGPVPIPGSRNPVAQSYGAGELVAESAQERTAQPRSHQQPQASHAPLSGAEMHNLYCTYQKRVYRQCLRMVRNSEDAEDLTQEVFLRLFEKIHTFRGESRFSTWLHSLTFNLVLMELRKLRRRPVASVPLGGLPGLDDDNPLVHEVEKTLAVSPNSIVDRVRLDTALARLPSGYREIFFLHDAEGYGHEEIASLLGISAGTSKSQLHKARYKLRTLLQSDGRRNPRGKTRCDSRRRTVATAKHVQGGVRWEAA
jgi:RNA polymerase sigma-70 factor (ECF subfamily)